MLDAIRKLGNCYVTKIVLFDIVSYTRDNEIHFLYVTISFEINGSTDMTITNP